jgi:GT2 family glycosyltransferase
MLAAVVTHFQTPDETRACLRSLRASDRAVDRIIVVDNGSRPPFAGDAETLRVEENLGFGGGCNLGIARALDAGADSILLLNSDAEVAPDCVALLEAALSPGIGIVGPTIVRRGAPPRVESAGVRFSPRTGRMINLGAGHLDGPRPPAPRRVESVIGCCMLIRRQVFERIGGFAAELFYGFEDLDFTLRAAAAGFATLCQPRATVWHLGARTIGERSPARLYFAARNHLRVAETAAPLPRPASAARALAIVGYNVAHAVFTSPAPRWAGLLAVGRGVRDHLRRRYGRGSLPS